MATRKRPLLRRGLTVTALAAATVCIFVGPAAAQDATTIRMSCTAVRQLVAQRRAIVLRTSPSTYDRYVSGRASCMPTETLEDAFVPTADSRACHVGYTCREPKSPY
jgi:hypothetical protein